MSSLCLMMKHGFTCISSIRSCCGCPSSRRRPGRRSSAHRRPRGPGPPCARSDPRAPTSAHPRLVVAPARSRASSPAPAHKLAWVHSPKICGIGTTFSGLSTWMQMQYKSGIARGRSSSPAPLQVCESEHHFFFCQSSSGCWVVLIN